MEELHNVYTHCQQAIGNGYMQDEIRIDDEPTAETENGLWHLDGTYELDGKRLLKAYKEAGEL